MTIIRITAGGYRFRAEANPAAPATVAAFVDLLPLRARLLHVRWSGEACWVPMGTQTLGLRHENATSYPSAGDVLFYPGRVSETEILIAYGGCRFGSKVGQLAGNHFLTVVEGREHLRELGEKTLWEGAQDVLFELE